MQLTNDDVKTYNHKTKDKFIFGKYIAVSKFLEVRAFYEQFKVSSLKLNTYYPELYERYIKETPFTGDSEKLYNEYRNWLFNYCFEEGLK